MSRIYQLKINLFYLLSIFIVVFTVTLTYPQDGYTMNHGSDEDIEEITTGMAKTKITTPHPVTLARFTKEGHTLVRYTRQINVKRKPLHLNRKSTRECVQYVGDSSQKDSYKSHLLVQGICMSTSLIWPKPFTTKLGFPDVAKTLGKRMDWVSAASTTVAGAGYHCHKSSSGNGHSEPQFMSDIQAVFKKSSDVVVGMFIPPVSNTEAIHLCGLELFGSFDMCDDCLNGVREFRKKHQEGQKSVSQAIRDELKRRKVKFKSEPEDAFVLIYHSKYPYKEITSYNAEDEGFRYELGYNYNFNGGRADHFCPTVPDVVDDTYKLSQGRSVLVKPYEIYGYIHQLADKSTTYDHELKRFSFQ